MVIEIEEAKRVQITVEQARQKMQTALSRLPEAQARLARLQEAMQAGVTAQARHKTNTRFAQRCSHCNGVGTGYFNLTDECDAQTWGNCPFCGGTGKQAA